MPTDDPQLVLVSNATQPVTDEPTALVLVGDTTEPVTDEPTELILVDTFVAPGAPAIIALEQTGTYVQAIVTLPPITGSEVLTLLRLYRAPSSAGPWTAVDNVSPSPISRYNNLYDLNPGIGHQNYYAATVVTVLGESAPSPILSIAPYAA